MIAIYVRYTKAGKFQVLSNGFNSIHEAISWLSNTYDARADIWTEFTEVKIK